MFLSLTFPHLFITYSNYIVSNQECDKEEHTYEEPDSIPMVTLGQRSENYSIVTPGVS